LIKDPKFCWGLFVILMACPLIFISNTMVHRKQAFMHRADVHAIFTIDYDGRWEERQTKIIYFATFT
jgi:hypothetical protein